MEARAAAMYAAKVIEVGEEGDHKGWLKLRLANNSLWGHSFWAAPAMHPNLFWIPDVDDMVFVFFESGFWDDAYWFGMMVPNDKWPEELSGAKYPKMRILKTLKGNKIEIDDTDGSEGVTISSAPKDGKFHEISLNTATEEITIKHSSEKYTVKITKEGNVEVLAESVKAITKDVDLRMGKLNIQAGNSVRIVDEHENETVMDGSGVEIKDKNSNSIVMSSSGVKIKDKRGSTIKMANGKIEIKASGQVILNGGSQGVVRAGDKSLPHTHIIGTPTGPGTASPATVAFSPVSVSKKVKAG